MTKETKIRQAIYDLLMALGEDPEREGLKETPDRVSRMYQELCSGLTQDPKEAFTAFFEEEHEDLIVVKDIPFSSLCEHHLLPFYGVAHVAYLPNKTVTGLSKLARAVEIASKRPQLQERLTKQVAESLDKALSPKGVFVMIEAEHMCMSIRGIKKAGSKTVTTMAKGVFVDDKQQRLELLQLIKG